MKIRLSFRLAIIELLKLRPLETLQSVVNMRRTSFRALFGIFAQGYLPFNSLIELNVQHIFANYANNIELNSRHILRTISANSLALSAKTRS